MILKVPVVLEFVMIFVVLFVVAVGLGLRAIAPVTLPVLCHRNTSSKEGNYRCNQNNLYKFRFHGILLSVEICPFRRNDFGNGLRIIDRTSVKAGEAPKNTKGGPHHVSHPVKGGFDERGYAFKGEWRNRRSLLWSRFFAEGFRLNVPTTGP
jgi:hypothetical protein